MAGQSRRRESSLVAVFFREIFIDGLSGMALGLFSTLIIGTILGQAAGFLPSPVDGYVQSASLAAKTITGYLRRPAQPPPDPYGQNTHAVLCVLPSYAPV